MPSQQRPTPASDPAAELRHHIARHWTSQAEFARAAGISPIAIAHFLSGRRGFSTRVAAAVQRTIAVKERRSRLTLARLLGIA